MDMQTYWNDRTIKHGHTGWASPLIYLYDQTLRIVTIKKLIEQLSINGHRALDYGCGVGDFSRLLGNYFQSVVGVDISQEAIKVAQSHSQNRNIHYELIGSKTFEATYDLIISITVLQHVTEDDMLCELLKNIHNCLSANGKLIIMESFSDNVTTDYLKLRRFEDVVKFLSNTGFKLLQAHNFYHPQYLPTKNFSKYRGNLIVRSLNKLDQYSIPFAKTILKKFAESMAHKDNGIVESDSWTKILILEK